MLLFDRIVIPMWFMKDPLIFSTLIFFQSSWQQTDLATQVKLSIICFSVNHFFSRWLRIPHNPSDQLPAFTVVSAYKGIRLIVIGDLHVFTIPK